MTLACGFTAGDSGIKLASATYKFSMPQIFPYEFATLKRGFSIIRDVNNKVIKNSKNLKGKDKIKAEFFDEEIILNIKNDRG